MKFSIIILIICFLISCQQGNVKRIAEQEIIIGNISYRIYEWEFQNHIYIIVDNKNPSITHAGHCTCNKKIIK